VKGYSRALLLFAMPSAVWADSLMPQSPWANTALPNAQQEQVARNLMEEIRCLSCQGQSIADSDAESASNMRALIRQRIAAGEAPESIRTWLIERYGSYITYAPPFSWATAFLWMAPLLLLAMGLVLMRGRFRRRKI
jgi:cytochrome c-type biogenesis protein CcmH